MKNTIVEKRNNSVLEKQYNYGSIGGVMTRREFITFVKNNGGTCESEVLRDHVKEEKEQVWLRANVWSHPFGNSNHPQTIAYNARKNALKDGIYKTVYRAIIPMPGLGRPYITHITKIEFDFFNSL